MGVVMRFISLVSALALGAALGAALAGPGSAQTVSQLGGPAELPPSGYSANQYVDSRGCVFIRAGYGGQETWVPRVTRQRQALCGYQPTGGGGATAVVSVAPPITPQAPATPEPPVTIVVAPTRPVQQTVVVRQVPVQTAPAPVTVTVTTAAVATRPGNCPNLPGSAGQFMRGENERCGPQPNHPGDVAGGMVIGYGDASGTYSAPEGYRTVWTDGRLNPYRGLAVATPQGAAAQDQYWQNTVPLTAIDLRVVIVPDPGPATVTRSSSTPSSAAAATSAPVQVAATDRYVEVARYRDRSLADRARQQLLGQGMPTSLGMVSGSGTLVVLAGPFDDPQSLGRTLNRALDLGYSAAVTRR
jgi:SPOR domain